MSRLILAAALRSLANEANVRFVDGMDQGECAVDDFRFWRLRAGMVTPDVFIMDGGDVLVKNPKAALAMAAAGIKKLLAGPKPI